MITGLHEALREMLDDEYDAVASNSAVSRTYAGTNKGFWLGDALNAEISATRRILDKMQRWQRIRHGGAGFMDRILPDLVMPKIHDYKLSPGSDRGSVTLRLAGLGEVLNLPPHKLNVGLNVAGVPRTRYDPDTDPRKMKLDFNGRSLAVTVAETVGSGVATLEDYKSWVSINDDPTYELDGPSVGFTPEGLSQVMGTESDPHEQRELLKYFALVALRTANSNAIREVV